MPQKPNKQSAKKAPAKKLATKAAAKQPKKAARKTGTKLSNEELLAKGGGSAPAAGVPFQGSVGAFFAVAGMAQRKVDERIELGAERIEEFRFETEAPLDDVLMLTDGPGRLFVQAKTNLSFETKTSSEMGKTVEQIVRQWKLCSEGDGSKDWNTPLDKDKDRFVIAVGQNTPKTVAVDLADALSRRRQNGVPAATPAKLKEAMKKFTGHLKVAWKTVYGKQPTQGELAPILDRVVVAKFEFPGPDSELGAEILGSSLADPETARGDFMTLAGICQQRMRTRTGFNMQQIRRALEQKGVVLLAPPNHRSDQEKLRKYSDKIRKRLARFSELKVDDATSIPIPRPVAQAALAAAAAGSLLIVGEPGAGKTGVIYNVAKELEASGNTSLMLAVDDAGSINLQTEIGVEHPIRDVLEHWPGTDPVYLLIDGLDAARGGPAEAIYKRLITEVLELPEQRWRVIATVRTFDLKAGQHFKPLFKGVPPDESHREAGSDFDQVRHVIVKRWTEPEFELLLQSAPKLRVAIDASGPKLRELALVPFNTQLLAEVISIGVGAAELGSIRNQRQLLDLYWKHRVDVEGAPAAACLTSVVTAMVEKRSLEIDIAPIRQEHAAVLDAILHSGVLVTRSNERFLAFRHNIIFDYAASRLYLNPFEPTHLRDLFLRDRGLGLILSPALGFALQELWDAEADHSKFWGQFALLAGDKNIDPIAKTQVARLGCEWISSAQDVEQFLGQLRNNTTAREVFSSATGALSIMIEDAPHRINVPGWAYVISELSKEEQFTGNISFLVDRFLKLPLDTSSFRLLGIAARNMLERGFAQ
jgi:hypothetical protein